MRPNPPLPMKCQFSNSLLSKGLGFSSSISSYPQKPKKGKEKKKSDFHTLLLCYSCICCMCCSLPIVGLRKVFLIFLILYGISLPTFLLISHWTNICCACKTKKATLLPFFFSTAVSVKLMYNLTPILWLCRLIWCLINPLLCQVGAAAVADC